MPVLIGSVILAVAAAVGLAIALCGRRVDDHPHCRRCGYNLTGRAGDVCPECGSDLTRRRAVKVGGRQVRRGAAVVTAAVLVMAGVLPAWRAYGKLRTFRWVEHEPAWLLRRDLAGPRYATALAELTRRVSEGQLSQSQVDAAADRCLTIQADATVQWDPDLGDFIECAMEFGQLDQARRAKYGAQAFGAGLELPERTRDDRSRVYFKVHTTFARVSYVWSAGTTAVVGAAIDGTPVEVASVLSDPGRFEIHNHAWSVQRGYLASSIRLERALARGNHRLELSVQVTLPEPARTWHSPPPPLRAVVKLTGMFPVVAAEPDPDLIVDPKLAGSVDAAFDRCETRVTRSGKLELICHFTSMPVRAAFDVRVGGGDLLATVVAGGFDLNPGETGERVCDLPAAFTAAGAIDVRLVPGGGREVWAVDVDRHWGGTLVRRRVPVVRRAE